MAIGPSVSGIEEFHRLEIHFTAFHRCCNTVICGKTFLQHGGKRALVTDPTSLPRALEGRAGTHFLGHL